MDDVALLQLLKQFVLVLLVFDPKGSLLLVVSVLEMLNFEGKVGFKWVDRNNPLF